MMKRVSRWLALAVLFAGAASAVGCKASECERMSECCAAVEGAEGVGRSCGEFAKQTKDPDTCRSVLRTMEMMYEDRGTELPRACKAR